MYIYILVTQVVQSSLNNYTYVASYKLLTKQHTAQNCIHVYVYVICFSMCIYIYIYIYIHR